MELIDQYTPRLVPDLMPDQTPGGRPTACTEKVRRDLIQAFRMGATIEMACYYAMISKGTYYKWQQQVRNRDMTADLLEEKVQLFDDIQKARADLQVHHLQQIEDFANTDWRAAAWKLERIFPRDFAPPKQQFEIDAVVDTAAQPELVRETFDLKQLSDEQLDQVMSILEGVKTTVIEVVESGSNNGAVSASDIEVSLTD